MKGQTLTRRY